LEKLEGAHPLIDLIGEHRELAKLLSTYVETLPTQADRDGRIHTTFNQTIAATGRLSSTDPNLQNIPIRTEVGRQIRRAFIAGKGMELLSCDYSQIELRVIAALSGDKNMLAAFRSGEDIHAATAAAIWHIPVSKVTSDQRRAAKAFNFGTIYGQGPHGLAKAAGIPYADAKKFIEVYFETYRGVKAYLEETKAKAHALGYVETLFGRRRPIPDINSGIPMLQAAAERMAINMPVQGTATGDLIKLALIALAQELPKHSTRATLLLQVHDEVVLEVPKEEVTMIAHVVRNVMEHVEKIGCPIVVDAKHGRNWEEMKPV
jgi:DNA polymerase I